VSIYLTDDGTLDTVLRCDECGEEIRYSSPYDANEPFNRDEWIDEIIADEELEHVCNEESI
jgi:hypothetical protein